MYSQPEKPANFHLSKLLGTNNIEFRLCYTNLVKRILKKLGPIFLLILAAAAIYAYQNPSILSSLNIDIPINLSAPINSKPSSNSDKIVFTDSKELGSVLSATSEKISQGAKNLYDKVTNEQEEALINKTVENISRQVKDLPKEQVEKVKYEFCKDIIEEYENSKESVQ